VFKELKVLKVLLEL
jgi:hypothetical protein